MKLPNKLTFLRILAAPVYLVLLAVRTSTSGGVAIGFAIAAMIVLTATIITDFLDGYFARKLEQTSELGIFLDPIADKLLVLPPLIWLLHVGAVSAWVVIIIVARELIVSSLRLLVSSKGSALAAKLSGKIKTGCEYTLLILLTAWLGADRVTPWFSWGCAVIAALSAAEYVYLNKEIIAEAFHTVERKA